MKGRSFALMLAVAVPAAIHAGILVVGVLIYMGLHHGNTASINRYTSGAAIDVIIDGKQAGARDGPVRLIRIVVSAENKGMTPVTLTFDEDNVITIARVIFDGRNKVSSTFGPQIHPPLIDGLSPVRVVKQKVLQPSETCRYASIAALGEPGIYLLLVGADVRQGDIVDGSDSPKHLVASNYVSIE